ncbi:acyl-CoA thioesterase [Hydrogenovibrio halophilus]|uniref:acyl-CoA thioesterase n=1 Tax=Hydrogenovibrio halophilus TaxID=373391 RepID=UPI0003760E5D|nr:acyl-CoA thioesterase [Hydrogenovibrio halophilus]
MPAIPDTQTPVSANARFSQRHRVATEELDFLGHVNNKQYLSWMETVAWAHANAVGIDADTQKTLNRIMVVHEHRMRYLKECRKNDGLILHTWLGKPIGCCRRERHFAFVRETDGQCVFEATSVYVCIDLTQHRPRPIPAGFIVPYAQQA